MSYDEEQQRKSRVVVQTPTSRREVVRTETERYPERSGVSTGVVATVAILAIALTAIVVYFLMSSNNTATDNTNVRVTAATQPTPVQPQQVVVQQPAPTQPPTVIVQQPTSVPPPTTVVVPGPSTSTSTTTTGSAPAPRSSGTDDATIQASIDRKLSDSQTFSALGITATVIDGKVTLIGTVETPELKRQVESLVRNVKGVQKVDNQIIVSGGTE